jgi:hypothetical protein
MRQYITSNVKMGWVQPSWMKSRPRSTEFFTTLQRGTRCRHARDAVELIASRLVSSTRSALAKFS